MNHPGILYVVATPIGNLKDISQRAIEVLQSVNCIAAEDTRHSKHLLKRLAITVPLISLHEHNEKERANQLIKRLCHGESMALISDAGTPLISDPGYILVKEVKNAGIQVVPIPGPCAAIAALSVAGLPTDRFIFEGFLPSKAKLRKERLEGLQFESRTLIFYEAPHRILASLQAIREVFGSDRQITLARELTKVFETIRSGKIEEIIDWVERDPDQQRGEIIVLVEGVQVIPTIKNSVSSDKILKILLEILPVTQAVEIAFKVTDKKKNELYKRALQLK
ncbi:MAG: rRNA ((1402)-2-O)-methyltransferase [Gammaproteobacteria bacterium]|nr:rRNA ((1402)-2-O)-methyltransferase [Gammaproteobacteria bacterium]